MSGLARCRDKGGQAVGLCQQAGSRERTFANAESVGGCSGGHDASRNDAGLTNRMPAKQGKTHGQWANKNTRDGHARCEWALTKKPGVGQSRRAARSRMLHGGKADMGCERRNRWRAGVPDRTAIPPGSLPHTRALGQPQPATSLGAIWIKKASPPAMRSTRAHQERE